VNVIGELAAFITTANAAALPAPERERLRLHVTDTAVAALAGAHIAEGRALRQLGIDGLAGRIGLAAAAIRLTEIDDIHLASCVTPSAGVVPVALLLAAHEQRFDPAEIASAIWAGTEVAVRIGLAVDGPRILYRGIWPTYLVAPVAAAATAARLFGLDQARTAHALSLAVMLMAGGVGRIHGAPSGRWFLYANAVAGGVAAAEAARADYRGDPELLDKDWLADTRGIALDRARLTGKTAASVYAALSLKPLCSAKQGIAAIQAFRAILDGGVAAAAITKVRVRVPKAYAAMIATPAQAGARQSTMVSVAHQLALAALAPQRLSDVDRSAPHEDEAVRAFAAKVEVVPEPALEAFYPQHWPAEVEVDAGGTTLRQRVVEAAGDPEHPLDAAAVTAKAHRVLDPLVGSDRAAEWLKLADAVLDDRAACRSLAEALAAGL
jgi:2-methylcitrate dehydratase PrpD